MSNLETYKSKIIEYNDQITILNNEIGTINSEQFMHPDIANMLNERKKILQNRVDEYVSIINVFQNLCVAELTAANEFFTEEEQKIVSTIDPKYTDQIENLKRKCPATKSNFFSLYTKTTNDTQKECVIKAYFGL